MNRIRQDRIKEYIEEKNVVTIKELQELFPEVSLMTIHRDLDVLEATGVVVKFRGGARSVRYAGDPEFNVRMRDNNSGKLLIARKAMELIQPHSSIFLDASTSNLTLARTLPDMNLNIFTTGPSIALELCRLHNPVVTLCCGTINRKNLALSGQNTLEMLEKINIDMAFIGVSGCSVDAGFTSIMVDASALPFEENITESRRTVEYCHFYGIPVEVELGALGGKEDDIVGEEGEGKTDPDMVVEFVERTGCDMLAVSVGNVHGLVAEPHIDLDLLDRIHKICPVPLVMHGGSGIPYPILQEARKHGLLKCNFGADLRKAFISTFGEAYEANHNAHDVISLSLKAVDNVAAKAQELVTMINA